MNEKQTITDKLIARFYPVSSRDAFEAAFCVYARSGMKVLDAGCGATRGCCSGAPLDKMFIIGIDQDPAVHKNPFCNETHVCSLTKLPFNDGTFDIIHCRWVVEHLENPEKAFCEFARVLKPSKHLLILTPNIFHYATVIARLTPQRFHNWWLRGGEKEPFSTFYRANSPFKLRKLCKNAGLRIHRLELVEKMPHYLVRYWPLFLCGVLYERFVNSTSMLSWMRHRILLDAVAPAGPT